MIDTVLLALLLWSLASSVALCFRLLLLGSEIFDFEKLVEQRRNGLTRIESLQHIRTEATFALIAVLLIASGLFAAVGAPWSREVVRWLLVTMGVILAITPILDWIDRHRKLRLTIGEERAGKSP